MAYLSLDPVSAGLYTALNVSGMTALATGGVYENVPQSASYPLLWYEVRENDMRGFGTGGLPEVEIRIHALSQARGYTEAQAIIQKAIELLRDQPLTVNGYTQAGLVFYDETVNLGDQELNGVKVKELVAMFRTYVEE